MKNIAATKWVVLNSPEHQALLRAGWVEQSTHTIAGQIHAYMVLESREEESAR